MNVNVQAVKFLVALAVGQQFAVQNPVEVAAVLKQHAEVLAACHKLPARKVLEAAEALA